MSLIPSRTAAGLLRMTPSYFGRLMKRFGLKPAGRRHNTGGQPEKLWSKTQILGLMIAGALVRAGVSEEWANAFPALFAGSCGDEQLEAVLTLEGRKWLLIAGSAVVPELLTMAEAEERIAENTPMLEAMRIPTTLLDISELFNDLMEAVRSVRAAEQAEFAQD